MSRSLGLLASDHVTAGIVENHRLSGAIHRFPNGGESVDDFLLAPSEEMIQLLLLQIEQVAQGGRLDTIGIGFPGVIRNGVIQESPNLQQTKGLNLRGALTAELRQRGIDAPVFIFNDADAMAAGMAAVKGHLEKLVRVWTLGNGIGYGRYPWVEGTWEGGHMVVSLDPREHYCGCGGQGHLEGIMGNRAMRLRFLDREPDDIFRGARDGEARCASFVKLWHRALAAATASSIHLEGPGKYFLTGPNARYVDLSLLHLYLHEMVAMTALQGSMFEVVPPNDEIAIIGAAVDAEMMLAKG